MGTIENFKKVFERGVIRSNRYIIIIVPPPILPVLGAIENLSYACEAVDLPGTLIATQEDRLFGPIRKMPYVNLYTDLNLTFICSHEMAERSFFEAWLEAIIYPAGSTRNRPGHAAPGENAYKIEFYENYTSTININVLDEQNIPVKSIVCYECYPIEIVNQPLAYANNDAYLKLDVRLAYRNWAKLL